MKVRTILLNVTVVSTLAVFSVPAQAGHTWSNYHWERAANPLTLDLGDNLEEFWGVHLEAASADWNGSSVLLTTVVGGSTKPRQCRAQAGNVQVCNLSYGNNGWLGIAGISVSGGHITAAYVKVNDTYFDTPSYDDPDWRQYVMCQEVGHAFGLGHVNVNFNDVNTGSCMDYTGNPIGNGTTSQDNTTTNQHDFDQLEVIYSDLDGGGNDGGDGDSGCNPRRPFCNGGLPAADIMAGINANGPAQWGRLISAHGPQEVYEMDFGGGNKIITHVTWTIQRANDHEH